MRMLVETDLFHQDVSVVERTLYYMWVMSCTQRNDEELDKCDEFVSVGGCFTIVAFLKMHLIAFSNCKRIASESALQMMHVKSRLLYRALLLIMAVAYRNKDDRVNVFSGCGAIEATIAVMEAIPLDGSIQGTACGALLNLAANERIVLSVAPAEVARGMRALIAALHQHLTNGDLCCCACSALRNLTLNNNENTRLMRNLGGVIAVATVMTNWPDNSKPTDAAKCLMIVVCKMYLQSNQH
jgi:hypothetical protein